MKTKNLIITLALTIGVSCGLAFVINSKSKKKQNLEKEKPITYGVTEESPKRKYFVLHEYKKSELESKAI